MAVLSTPLSPLPTNMKELAAMKKRVEEMEAEASKLREMHEAEQKDADGQEGSQGEAMETEDDRQAADSRSVYVGNVRAFCDFRLSEEVLTWFETGRLQRLTRGNPGALPVVWDD